jgi:regulator of RNase E activity RraA
MVKVSAVDVPVKLQSSSGVDVTICPGDYIVADINGVVLLPKALVEEALPLMAKQVDVDSRMAVALREGMSFSEASKKFRT